MQVQQTSKKTILPRSKWYNYCQIFWYGKGVQLKCVFDMQLLICSQITSAQPPTVLTSMHSVHTHTPRICAPITQGIQKLKKKKKSIFSSTCICCCRNAFLKMWTFLIRNLYVTCKITKRFRPGENTEYCLAMIGWDKGCGSFPRKSNSVTRGFPVTWHVLSATADICKLLWINSFSSMTCKV